MKLFDDLCNLIIRPQRHKYRLSELGPKVFVINGYKVQRTDFEISVEESPLYCSLYKPHNAQAKTCVIYLHSNSGSRMEGGRIKDLLLFYGIPVCLFDFRGSGLSSGDYVSYGHFQKQDLFHVVSHLAQHHGFESFVLWGRSMGAATALMFAADPAPYRILLTIADSSYFDLKNLLQHIGGGKMGIPMFILKPLLYMFESSISRTAGFNLSDIHLEKYLARSMSPVVFVASKCDSVVPIAHSERLYKEYRGNVKELFYIDQDHQHQRKPADLNYLVKIISRAVARANSNQNIKLSMLLSRRGTLPLHPDELHTHLPRCSSSESIQESSTIPPMSSRSNRSQYKINLVCSRKMSSVRH